MTPRYIFIQAGYDEDNDSPEAYWSDNEEALNIYMEFKQETYNITPGNSVQIDLSSPTTALSFAEEIQEHYNDWYDDLGEGDYDTHLEANKYRDMIERLLMVDAALKSELQEEFLVECIEEPRGMHKLEGFNLGDTYKCQRMYGPFGRIGKRELRTYYRFYPGDNTDDNYYEVTSHFPQNYFKKVSA